MMSFFKRERKITQVKEGVNGFVYPKLKPGVEKRIKIQRDGDKVLWIQNRRKEQVKG